MLSSLKNYIKIYFLTLILFIPVDGFCSVLFRAIESNNVKSVEKILKMHHFLSCGLLNPANTERNKKGQTALHVALEKNTTDKRIIELLLKSNCNPNIQDKNGQTPLQIAVKNNLELQIIKLLIKHGASLEVKNQNGETILHSAIANKVNLDTLHFLIEEGAHLNTQDLNGNTPLHLASRTVQNSEIISILLSHGANLFIKNTSHYTPLHEAAKYNPNPQVIAVLLSQGGSVREREEVNPALHLAALHNPNSLSIDILINDRNHNINRRNAQGNTALEEVLLDLQNNQADAAGQQQIKIRNAAKLLMRHIIDITTGIHSVENDNNKNILISALKSKLLTQSYNQEEKDHLTTVKDFFKAFRREFNQFQDQEGKIFSIEKFNKVLLNVESIKAVFRFYYAKKIQDDILNLEHFSKEDIEDIKQDPDMSHLKFSSKKGLLQNLFLITKNPLFQSDSIEYFKELYLLQTNAYRSKKVLNYIHFGPSYEDFNAICFLPSVLSFDQITNTNLKNSAKKVLDFYQKNSTNFQAYVTILDILRQELYRHVQHIIINQGEDLKSKTIFGGWDAANHTFKINHSPEDSLPKDILPKEE